MEIKFKRLLCLCLCLGILTSMFSFSVNADIGPKASVHILFENMGDELCYGTLLSKAESTGPQSVWDGDEDNIYNYDLDIDIWRAFVEYEDEDGYYFLQCAWKVSEKKEIAWTYYPPNSFKILLYYPETEMFIVSDIYERYAFDTYYTVDMLGIDISGDDFGSVELDEELSSNARLNAYKSYMWRQEALALVARIFITIVIEMLVALLFGFRGKKAILTLVAVNTATQIVLNLLLNLINFKSGEWAFIFGYIMLEIAVFAVEAIIYSVVMNRYSSVSRSTRFYVIYSLVANVVSFGVGLPLSLILPSIF